MPDATAASKDSSSAYELRSQNDARNPTRLCSYALADADPCPLHHVWPHRPVDAHARSSSHAFADSLSLAYAVPHGHALHSAHARAARGGALGLATHLADLEQLRPGHPGHAPQILRPIRIRRLFVAPCAPIATTRTPVPRNWQRPHARRDWMPWCESMAIPPSCASSTATASLSWWRPESSPNPVTAWATIASSPVTTTPPRLVLGRAGHGGGGLAVVD